MVYYKLIKTKLLQKVQQDQKLLVLYVQQEHAEAIDDYWIPSVCNELGTATTPPAYCLNFGSEINTYQLTDYSGDTNSLFQKYYENYITRIFNKKSRIFNFLQYYLSQFCLI